MSGADEGEASGRVPNVMSSAQGRAARALLDWSAAELARRSGLDESLVRTFEAGTGDPPSGAIEALRSTLAQAGVAFDGASGVRLTGRGGDEGTRLGDLTTENDR